MDNNIEPRKKLLRRLNVSITQAVVLQSFLDGPGSWRYWRSIDALCNKGMLINKTGHLVLTILGRKVAEELKANADAFHAAFLANIEQRKAEKILRGE